MDHNTPNMTRRARGKKGQKPPALKPCPSKDFIHVMQFQFFDNGPTPGKGKTRHTVKLEVYLEGKINLSKPHWNRTVALIEADEFRAWADRALIDKRLTPEQHSTYAGYSDAIAERAKWPETAWAKLGRIEDKRAHADYPGQFIMAWRDKNGPMQCHVVVEDGTMSCERFIHDQLSTPGSGRRKAFGFYDPNRIYERQQAEAEALKSGRNLRDVLAERGFVKSPDQERAVEQIDLSGDQPGLSAF